MTDVAPLPAPAAQPMRAVQLAETRLTILGTAHVSKASAEEVERLIAGGEFDAVAIELDPNRHAALTRPHSWAQIDLLKALREGKAAMLAANLALGAFQQRLADQLGVEPGQEMRLAISAAAERHLPLLLIDRDIGITLRRVYRSVPWWQRLTLFSGIIASVLVGEKVSEAEIEKLKQGDILEATFSEFAEKSAALYRPLIAERDRYMACRLREELARKPYQNVLVVVGAGHLKGLVEALETPETRPPREERLELEAIPKGRNWGKVIPWLITALILSGFAIGFSRSPELGLRLILDWVIINGGLAAIGATIALAHPLTIVGVFFAAPLTSLNPLVGAGFVAAGIEVALRRPLLGDFATLRRDVTKLRGWWRNRVARTLLVFILTTIGSALGTYLGGFSVMSRLMG
ncbi:MAG: TraB/GumN family protein [Truepera sp.]|nr:TraB/GumN family protein [Truepera sp.]